MTLFVDTSVWSAALRRDAPQEQPQLVRLREAIEAGETLVSTGLVLQELLQGFNGPRDRQAIVDRFAVLPFLTPARSDHVEAAELRNLCRRQGVQIGTVDALLAQLCLSHGLVMLTTDQDFSHVARHTHLQVWATQI